MSSKPVRTPWRNLLLAVLAPCVFLLALEGVLAVAGFAPGRLETDPFVGFSGNLPLFVPGVSEDGTPILETAPNKRALFNLQTFPAEKTPGTVRIFCLGGSTTYGRPYNDATSFCGWLREMLPEADPSHPWEVINAGGISYASYRVAHLMEELSAYAPDLFIVYTGHNEFLEDRTYAGLRPIPRVLRHLGTWAAQTRTGGLMTRCLPKKAVPAEVLPAEVETRLDNSAGPEVYHRDDTWRDGVLRHFEFNLAHLAQIAEDAGAELLFVTPASNLRECSPFKSEHRPGLSEEKQEECKRHFKAARRALNAGNLPDALEETHALTGIDPRHAHFQYLRGQVLWDLQHFEEAKTAFVRARDEDICPLRAVSGMADSVRAAARRTGAMLVDFEALCDDWAEEHVPGRDLFFDHVHPLTDTHRRMSLALIDALAERGIVHPGAGWQEASMSRIAARVEGRIDRKTRAEALRNLARVLGWAGKLEEAYGLAQESLALAENEETRHVAAALAHRLGLEDEAEAHLNAAMGAEGEP